MDYRIAHELPGRLRLRCAPGSLSLDRAHDLVARIVAVDGVAEAHATASTGSVLVRYASPAARGEVLAVVDGFVSGGGPARRARAKADQPTQSGRGAGAQEGGRKPASAARPSGQRRMRGAA
ncbi:MAG TPA: heavy metal translocating P-type ATPase, partial [Desulfovibrio sp.]|nr:heavy metal translocating P-type ATPase [Desulfovibrio sp.]